MSIIVNNGVQNILGTPGAISGVFADRPAAIDIANGTLYFSTDTTTIYQVDNGAWIVYTGGGGGGSVNSVTGTAPIASSGGANPVISISQSGAATNGFLNSTDWNTFNNKVGGSGVATRVAFFTGTNAIGSNAQLFWDNTNNRLGVGGSPFGYKLSVIDANYYARFGTTAGSDNNAVIFGKSVSSYVQLSGNTGERKILIGDGVTGFANFTTYNSNVIQFAYSNVLGGTQLPTSLTQFIPDFLYSTGVNSHTIIDIMPDILTTGGTNLLRGIYYNPNNSGSTGTRQIAWENTQGDIIFGNLSSNLMPVTFVDNDGKLGTSYLMNDNNLEQLYTLYDGNITGLSLDFLYNNYLFGAVTNNGTFINISDNDRVIELKTGVNNGNATFFKIDDLENNIFTSYGGSARGFYLDFANEQYTFGAYSYGNTTNIVIDDASRLIKLGVGSDIGLSLDIAADLYQFGAWGGDNYLQINANNGNVDLYAATKISLFCSNAGLTANGNNTFIGDVDNRNNNTNFGVDDDAQTLIASVNLITTNNGTAVNEHLKININGTDYVIQLRLA
jgi:hypothetical protein